MKEPMNSPLFDISEYLDFPDKKNESELHQKGKECFRYSEGMTIRLPDNCDPRFDPPKTFTISKVQIEQPLPRVKRRAEVRPDVTLTNPSGQTLLVEVTKTNSKTRRYTQQINSAGVFLALDLNVDNWEKGFAPEPQLDQDRAQFTQMALDQTTWLVPGLPGHMEWRPYAIVIYECNSHRCGPCTASLGGFRKHRDRKQLRLRYESPPLPLHALAKREHLSLEETRKTTYRQLSAISIPCPEVSTVTLNPSEDRYDAITDRSPETTVRETGWVLVRDGEELTKFRVRKAPDGFQPVIYNQNFWSGRDQPHPVDDFINNRSNHPPTGKPTWIEAVTALCSKIDLRIRPEPLFTFQNEWRPDLDPTFR